MAVFVDSSEVFAMAAKMAANAKVIDDVTEQAIKTVGYRGLGLVKKNASGRPGPRVRTGDYRRSLNVRFGADKFSDARGITHSATIGTNAPQAQRLEEGFIGADSLSRVYNQPAFPHFRPMAEQIQAEWATVMAAVVKEAEIRSGL